MKAVFTARRLNAGHYDDFRKAWEPDSGRRVQGRVLMRDTADPDQITVIGLFDVVRRRRGAAAGRPRAVRARPARADGATRRRDARSRASSTSSSTRRAARRATTRPCCSPSATSSRARSTTTWTPAVQYERRTWAACRAGLEFMLLQDTANPDHSIQLGIVRVADIQAFRDSVRIGPAGHARRDRAVRRIGRPGRRLRADRGGRAGPRLERRARAGYPLARCRKHPIETLRSSSCA